MFTAIDNDISGGFRLDGKMWNRNNDVIGLAFNISGISKEHQKFLENGGYDFIIGDGKLNYGLEQSFESYYKLNILKYFDLSLFYQFYINPAYNLDRGIINIFSIRSHFEF